ncbi:MAG: glycoside hydrolase family 88 protein [Clostridia bacterium]|nr:glycoside hydrolase family 88 protein [Clostridia bacterium]
MRDAVERYVSRLLAESTPQAPVWNVERMRSGAAAHWNYIDGCMLRALLRLGGVRNDARYAAFCKDFLAYYVLADGSLRGYDEASYNLDNICEGNALIDLYAMTGEERYLRAIERLQGQLLRQPRTLEGSFWHKLIYPNQVWLDGLYMAQVFRLRRANLLESCEYDDILLQFQTVRKRMYDPATRLYRHGYDASGKAFWADERGLSACVWLRAMGWWVAALADAAAEWPETHAGKAWLRDCLVEALSGLLAYRDADSGMFFQVVDQGSRAGNYPETSGTALAAYACLRGYNGGALGERFRDAGLSLLRAIEENKLEEHDGRLSLTGICLVAGLGPEDNERRDGSFDYYISEPVVCDEAKGVAPFLMAYAEAAAIGEAETHAG